MRIFIAVKIPGPLKKKIFHIQQELKSKIEKIKWVDAELLHFTLKFLGEISEEGLKKVEKVSFQIASESTPFVLEIKGMGIFPDYSSPRVIWIGVEEGGERIEELARRLDKKLSEEGFIKEKREWVPHLTIGRVKFLREKEKFKELILSKEKVEIGKMKVESLNIIQSHLTPKGPIYKTLKEYCFKEGENERREIKSLRDSQKAD